MSRATIVSGRWALVPQPENPGQCGGPGVGHDWSRPRGRKGSAACSRCPAVCRRDDDGKIAEFSADPAALPDKKPVRR